MVQIRSDARIIKVCSYIRVGGRLVSQRQSLPLSWQ